MCSVGGRAVSELNLDRLAPGWAVRGSYVVSEPRTARGSVLRCHHRPPDRSIANGAREGGFGATKGRYWRRAERPEWAHSDPGEAGYLPSRSLTIRDHRGGRAERPHSTSRPADRQRRQGGGILARGEGRRLTYPSIPRDPTGVHARFRALNFERLLPVSPAVIKRNSRGGVATDFAPAVDGRRRQLRRREEWAAAQFVWFKVWCFWVSTGSFCSLWPEMH